MSPKKTKYDEDDIDILEGLEPIRLRPHMYIGDVDEFGLHHILKEVIDNALDEYVDGNVTAIGVKIDTEKQLVSVADNGRGIPVKMHKKAKIPAITVIFTRMHSGSKFGKGAYTSTAVGLHGIGVKATSALSDKLVVRTKRDGETYQQEFSKGTPTTALVVSDKKLRSGTRITFHPDFSVFNSGVKFNPKRIRDLIATTAHLCPGLALELHIDSEAETFKSANGLLDLLDETLEGANKLHEPIVINTEAADIVLVWTDREGGDVWRSFVNRSHTPEHGTHVKGAKKAIQDTLISYADEKVGKLKGDDLRDGLVAIIHAKVVGPKFSSQTKLSLVNREVEGAVEELVSGAIRRFATANMSVVKSIIDKAVALRDSKQKFRAQQQALRGVRAKQGTRGVLPGKLCEAPDCEPEDRELFIVEGDSAFEPVKAGRIKKRYHDREVNFQEVLPLRGKSLNVAKTNTGDLSAALDNAELNNITLSIGTGVEPVFDLNKCRCGSIYILADADPDGKHITSLILSFFAVHMPKLIDAGRVHVILAPLFRGVTAKQTAYGDTIEEVKRKLGTDKNIRISRFKGLGEADPEDLETFAMNPKYRKVCHVVWGGDEDKELVLKYMGKDSQYRKEILGVSR